jgi:uncharacterized protein YqfB (UPF0267 family)
MKKGLALAIMALAAIIAAPALADTPQRCGLAESCHPDGLGGQHGWMLLVDDAARDNFQNMTIAEIEALKEKKSLELQNMTPAQIEKLRQQKREERDNMTLAELKNSKPKAQGRERLGGRSLEKGIKGHGFSQGKGRGVGFMAYPFLLWDNLTKDELNNMTLAEIKELGQKKMQELNNMTLAEIKTLGQQKRSELENMTIAELEKLGRHPGRTKVSGMGFGQEMWTSGRAEGSVTGP